MEEQNLNINPMEEFLKIKWADFSEMSQKTFLNKENQNSYVENLLDNCLETPYTSSESEFEEMDRDDAQFSQRNKSDAKKNNSWYLNQDILNKINSFPKSVMNSEQHTFYFSILLKNLSKSKDVLKEEEKIKFENLALIVIQEQRRFQEFAKTTNCSKTFTIPTEIKEYIHNALKHRFLRIKNYPQYYLSLNNNISMYGEGKSSVKMEMIKYLLHMGNVPAIILPNLKQRFKITNSRVIAEKKFPSECDNLVENKNIPFKIPVSEDKNASILASENDVDIVISSSGIRTLIESHINFQNEWNIPIIVKSLINSTTGTKKAVVFVDKPWTSLSMTSINQYKWYIKLAAKSALCHKKHMKAKNYPAPSCFCLSENTSENQETEDDLDKNCNCENRLISPLKHDNVVYSLWNMSSENKVKVSDLKILIRNRVDGFYNNTFMSIRPKIETQIEMGCEILSPQELTEIWAALYFKPKTDLLNVRVDMMTNELIAIDKIELKDLSFNHTPFIETLFSILNNLKDLQEGEYLLSHTQGNFCQLYKASNINEGEDKHILYENQPKTTNFPEFGFVPWTPIDLNIITNYHKNYSRIPGTFPPSFKPKNNKRRKNKQFFHKK